MSNANDSLISVNGEVIKDEDIAKEMQYHPAGSQEQAWIQSGEALAIKALLLQRAKTLQKSNELTLNIDVQQDENEEEAMIRLLLEKEVITPKADDIICKQYFDTNRSKFKSPDIIEASHILIAVAPDDIEGRDKAEKKANALLKELKRDKVKFATLAKQYSDCPSKEMGGNLGQLSPGSTVPEFERQLFAMEPGLFEVPVESRYGYHIVLMERKTEGRPLEFPQVKEKLAGYLDHQVFQRAVSQYIRQLVGAADIQGLAMDAAVTPLVQ